MREILKLLFLPIYLFTSTISAQQYGKGLLLDPEHYENVIVAAPLVRGDFLELPSSFSLKKYSPTPGNQGSYSTCAGWAAAYSARTILNSIKNNYINPLIDRYAFSPSYVYNQIRSDSSCSNGVFLDDALEILKNQGVLPLKEFGYECDRIIESQEKYRAGKNKILEYREIFNRTSTNKVSVTKKSISEYRPVIIALDIPGSFEHCKNIWAPSKDDYRLWNVGHALVVISYDDTLYGGAFEVINSWGTEWGNEGFMWISYKDFEYFTFNGFELIDDITNEKTPYDLSGSLKFRLENGDPIELSTDGKIFQTVNSYPSGTRFNVFLSNNQPAFVYAFGTDLKKKITMLFPENDNISPLLAYKKNNIALPNERSSLILDDYPGKSYLCFIYSNKQVDIKKVITKIEKSRGDISKRVFSYFKDNLVIEFDPTLIGGSEIKFETKSDGKSMIIIIVKFEHI